MSQDRYTKFAVIVLALGVWIVVLTQIGTAIIGRAEATSIGSVARSAEASAAPTPQEQQEGTAQGNASVRAAQATLPLR